MKPEELLTLKWLNCFDSIEDGPYDCVFAYPAEAEGAMCALKTMLDDTTPTKAGPALEERYRNTSRIPMLNNYCYC